MDAPQQIVTMISLGSIGMFMLASAVVFFIVRYQRKLARQAQRLYLIQAAHQQALLDTALNSQLKERERLGQDLHDNISGLLSAIRLKVQQIIAEEQRGEILSMLEEALKGIRQISRELMPVTLKKFGLVKGLKELCHSSQQWSEVSVDFICTHETIQCPKESSYHLYMAVKELIVNAIKHAKAAQVLVEMSTHDQLIVIRVTDDGKGFDWQQVTPKESQPSDRTGQGILGIQSRIKVIRGEVNWTTAPGKGTSVEISLVT